MLPRKHLRDRVTPLRVARVTERTAEKKEGRAEEISGRHSEQRTAECALTNYGNVHTLRVEKAARSVFEQRDNLTKREFRGTRSSRGEETHGAYRDLRLRNRARSTFGDDRRIFANFQFQTRVRPYRWQRAANPLFPPTFARPCLHSRRFISGQERSKSRKRRFHEIYRGILTRLPILDQRTLRAPATDGNLFEHRSSGNKFSALVRTCTNAYTFLFADRDRRATSPRPNISRSFSLSLSLPLGFRFSFRHGFTAPLAPGITNQDRAHLSIHLPFLFLLSLAFYSHAAPRRNADRPARDSDFSEL